MVAVHDHKGKVIGSCDPCIAPLVDALNQPVHLATVASCCGHGKWPGWIALADSRVLAISASLDDHKQMVAALDRAPTQETRDGDERDLLKPALWERVDALLARDCLACANEGEPGGCPACGRDWDAFPMVRPVRRLSRWWLHNLVAHPLLVLWPRLGEYLHERTSPEEET